MIAIRIEAVNPETRKVKVDTAVAMGGEVYYDEEGNFYVIGGESVTGLPMYGRNLNIKEIPSTWVKFS